MATRTPRPISRRRAITMFSVGAVSLALSACGLVPTAPSQASTAAPAGGANAPSQAAPTAAAAPAQPVPTQAPAPTAAPAPTQAPVPTAAVAQSADAGLLRPGGTPKRGGTFHMAFGVTVPHYDIHQGASSAVMGHMYNGLVRRNPLDGLRTIIPDLATKWEMSDDSLTYTFHLRQGVLYHDGAPFTADDVVATYNRIINPPQGMVSTLKQLLPMVKEIKKVDDATVQFTLKQPSAIFLEVVADADLIIYSKKTLDANNGDLRKVIAPGTGAFLYKSYQEAEKWTYTKNPAYWDKELPYIDSLELIHVPAWPDRGTAVLTGQADHSWNVSHDTWTAGQKRTDIVQTGKVPSFGAYAVFLNTTKKPFDDARVRKAVHLALSRQYCIQAFISQEWVDLTRWVPHGDQFATPLEKLQALPGYRDQKDQDIAQAKQLMKDAGYADGFDGVDFLAASVAPQSQIMAPAIQEQLKTTLNIGSKIRVQERALLVQQESSGTFGMVLDTPGGPISDVSPIAHLFWASNGSQNWGKYKNQKVDDLLAKSDAETDAAKRQPLLDQLQDELDNDPPWLLVGFTFHQTMWRNYVQGLAMDKRVMVEWGRVEPVWLDK